VILILSNSLTAAEAYGRSPKTMRRFSERKAAVEAEGRPPLQAPAHMAAVFLQNSKRHAGVT